VNFLRKHWLLLLLILGGGVLAWLFYKWAVLGNKVSPGYTKQISFGKFAAGNLSFGPATLFSPQAGFD